MEMPVGPLDSAGRDSQLGELAAVHSLTPVR